MLPYNYNRQNVWLRMATSDRLRQLVKILLKGEFMVIPRRKIIAPKIDIKIDNQSVMESDHSKFFGVYIDKKLIRKIHISFIAGTIARGVGILIKARKYFTHERMITLYYSFVFQYLIHWNHILG